MCAVADVRDGDGFADIGSYAVIGDGRSVALIAQDGTVDWWGVPQIDSTPAFAALLDPSGGGSFVLRPRDTTATWSRRYLPHTNQLETTYTTSSGSVRVVDSMNSGNAGPLPWTEFARRVDGIEGSVDLEFAVSAGTGLARWRPWTEHDARGTVLHAGDLTIGLRCSDSAQFVLDHERITGGFHVANREHVTLALVASDAEPLYLADVDAIESRIEYTSASWRHWSAQVQWQGAGREQLVRSALALKLLIVRSGAIAAAATTSLPERVGGDKNWDYRLAWIRDAALTIDAMAQCGLQEEVHAATAWLLRTIRRHGPDVHVVYTLDGSMARGTSRPTAPGYRHSRPVQIGNDATTQIQLGIYGDLFQTVATWVFHGHVLDTATARELADLADDCADRWDHQDAGIWELQDQQHYTSSKMNCWRALTRAAQLAEAGHIAGPHERWGREADAIRAWIDEHCWSERKQSYTFYAGTDRLDASILLAAKFAYDRGPRMSSTIDALRHELSAGPLLYRYTGAEKEEATFIACAFWTVEALALVGRTQQARTLMDELGSLGNDVGLLSEMAEADTFALIGNTPQALSHLAYIGAAVALRNAETDTAHDNTK